ISFATEAGLYQGVGIPTIVCGPGHIAQAHKPDEFVALDQIALCRTFLHDIIAANDRA
ncbi:MAG: M20/M25/M40 family metallo-hydrolase, partial [Proteobacteria bacterium]|nr:M20/M25/M40 family metallo-hydrolase [Pseudomonadota bacterium]